MNTDDFNIKSFHQMLLIFNAVLNGWKVSYRDNTFTFKKNRKKIQKKYLEDEYLRHFLKDNMKTDTLFN